MRPEKLVCRIRGQIREESADDEAPDRLADRHIEARPARENQLILSTTPNEVHAHRQPVQWDDEVRAGSHMGSNSSSEGCVPNTYSSEWILLPRFATSQA